MKTSTIFPPCVWRWLCCAALVAVWLPQTLSAQTVTPRSVQQATISAALQTQLAQRSGLVSFLVILDEQVTANAVIAAAQPVTPADRVQVVYDQLTAVARRTQAPLRAWLDAQGIPYRAFYLVNMLEVQGDAALVAAIRQRPEVARLVANPAVGQSLAAGAVTHTWLRPLALTGNAAQTQARPYGLDYTRAPAVWALGYTGQGIVIASQDTGVEWDHPALKLKYRGLISDTLDSNAAVSHPYNWFDAWENEGRPPRCAADPQIPCDDNGHGTHTVGTMLGDATTTGDAVLGMAPGAEWIGCRNMDNGVGTPASYTACFEFFFAPYPQGGDPQTDGKPALAPHIINNSWGCPPSEGCDAESLRQIVETVRAAGLMVVASAGNGGSGCSTVDDPIAIYDATFSVGAHDASGVIAGFSSRGPVTVDGSNRRKPDLSAPGVGVRSTYINDGYTSLNGTSMASPHVAGGVALLWSAVPTLTRDIDLTEQLLLKSATPVPFRQCGESAAVSPNHTYGFGRLDVLATVQMAQQAGALTVRVLDLQATPVPTITVTLTDALTGYRYMAITGVDGTAQIAPVYAGEYRLTTATGRYEVVTVTLAAGQLGQADVREVNPTGGDGSDEPQRASLYLPFVQP